MSADPAAADAAAQFAMGLKYTNGSGVAKDTAEAARWYRRAAEQGHVKAQCTLGLKYELGEGVVKDTTEAARWFRRAAEQGHTDASFLLAMKYEIGTVGVEENDAEAARWYRQAAEQGHAAAQYRLGLMYGVGRGVVKDEAKADKWCRRAADQGHKEAQAHCLALEKVKAQAHCLALEKVAECVREHLAAAAPTRPDSCRERGCNNAATDRCRFCDKMLCLPHQRTAVGNASIRYTSCADCKDDCCRNCMIM